MTEKPTESVPRQRSIAPHVSDLTALLGRIVVGVVFIAHGLPKAMNPEGTAQGFAAMGIPFPTFSALLGAVIEVGGGLALIIGLALPLAGLALAFMMAGAYYFVHVGDPLVGGYELALVMGATALALGFSGGRYSLDRLLPWGRRGRSRAAEAVSA
ncbi:DoxX family protein [Nocardiopsis lambiniae]|uniref:DoxX family protein n=1 Tax=Nocardiopsis lambiniae TaxID=3075539 RepID=A0ABU2M2P8_9ACTN|nr:DoxX family protein [Nocardiopsis sp. DSM 44743]MDT0326913.1 DoxX family protein [Nocardiopsis sp. DSM 44743]